MLITVSFPVNNHARIDHAWPIRIDDKIYHLKENEGCVVAVSVTKRGVPIELAPKLNAATGKPPEISFRDMTVWEAESDIRAWQAVVMPFSYIDVNFEKPTTEYKPENISEEDQIHVQSYTRELTVDDRKHVNQFEILGRAFFALDFGKSHSEPMSHFREGSRLRRLGRSIDAYNQFYLYLESIFCQGKTDLETSTNKLLASPEFMSGLESASSEDGPFKPDPGSFQHFGVWKTNPRLIIREIVALRGKLRHHNINSPKRWNPDRQSEYAKEATFISMIAQKVAFERTTSHIWDQRVEQDYLESAKEAKAMNEISVVATIRDDGQIREVGINISIPHPTANARLARAILTQVLGIIENNSPGADLYAIRAYTKRDRVELFRYDLGPAIPR